MRVTGKLKPCDGQWTVAVVIQDDGGGEMNVELSNQVLYVHVYIIILTHVVVLLKLLMVRIGS